MLVNKVPMIYKKHPKCLICMNPNASKIDKDLLHRVPYQEIAINRAALFKDSDIQLTHTAVYNHWLHTKEAVEIVVGLAIDGSGMPQTLAPGNDPHSPAGQRVFKEMVHRRVDEIAILEDLVLSGVDDLRDLTPTDADDVANDDADTKRLRNQVRKDTAIITMESAKVKLMAANSVKEQEHVERSRLVLRLFEIFSSSLSVVPEGTKGLISSRLKNALNQDMEIRDLLTVAQKQMRDSALPSIPASVKYDDD